MAIKQNDLVVRLDTQTCAVATSNEFNGKVVINQKGTESQCPTDQLMTPPRFQFEVFSKRWQHNDTYGIKLTKSGWYVDHIAIDGDCDPTGEPFLYQNFDQDSIKHQPELGSKLDQLWRDAVSGSASMQQIQERLNELAAELRRLNGGT